MTERKETEKERERYLARVEDDGRGFDPGEGTTLVVSVPLGDA